MEPQHALRHAALCPWPSAASGLCLGVSHRLMHRPPGPRGHHRLRILSGGRHGLRLALSAISRVPANSGRGRRDCVYLLRTILGFLDQLESLRLGGSHGSAHAPGNRCGPRAPRFHPRRMAGGMPGRNHFLSDAAGGRSPVDHQARASCRRLCAVTSRPRRLALRSAVALGRGGLRWQLWPRPMSGRPGLCRTIDAGEQRRRQV